MASKKILKSRFIKKPNPKRYELNNSRLVKICSTYSDIFKLVYAPGIRPSERKFMKKKTNLHINNDLESNDVKIAFSSDFGTQEGQADLIFPSAKIIKVYISSDSEIFNKRLTLIAEAKIEAEAVAKKIEFVASK